MRHSAAKILNVGMPSELLTLLVEEGAKTSAKFKAMTILNVPKIRATAKAARGNFSIFLA